MLHTPTATARESRPAPFGTQVIDTDGAVDLPDLRQRALAELVPGAVARGGDGAGGGKVFHVLPTPLHRDPGVLGARHQPHRQMHHACQLLGGRGLTGELGRQIRAGQQEQRKQRRRGGRRPLPLPRRPSARSSFSRPASCSPSIRSAGTTAASSAEDKCP